MVIKTDLDLEIERELQEMMENGESNKETKVSISKSYLSFQ